MAETPNLDLLLLEVGAPNREVVVNAGLTVLDSTVAGVLALDVAGSGDLTLTDTTTGEAKYGVLRLSGALTGARQVIVPDKGRRYLVENATTGAFTLTVKTAAGTGVAVPQGTWSALVCDGTDVVQALGSAGGVTPGTPLSVARYAADGVTVEGTQVTISADTQQRVGIGTATPSNPLHIVVEGEHGGLRSETYLTNAGGANFSFLKAYGSLATPALVPVNANMGGIQAFAYVRNDADTTNEFTQLTRQAHELDSVDAQGRAGARWRLLLSPGVSAPPAEVLRVSQGGNLGLGQTTFGSSATRTLALGPGVAPTTSPTDSVQLTAVDRGGTAGKRSLHVRTEDGTSHLLGDLSGIATTLAATLGSGASYQALTVNGSLLTVGQSSVQERAQALLDSSWVVSTDATRESRLALSVYDATAPREFLRGETASGAARIGFLGASASARITLPAAATDPATTQALANALRTALITFGLGA